MLSKIVLLYLVTLGPFEINKYLWKNKLLSFFLFFLMRMMHAALFKQFHQNLELQLFFFYQQKVGIIFFYIQTQISFSCWFLFIVVKENHFMIVIAISKASHINRFLGSFIFSSHFRTSKITKNYHSRAIAWGEKIPNPWKFFTSITFHLG